MQKKLAHKTAIITGANQGLGLTIAKHFIQEGANVVLCARDKMTLNAAFQALTTPYNPQQVLAIVADISQEKDCRALVKNCLAHFGQLDILVNNAGIHGAIGPVDEVDWASWEAAIDINVKGTVLMTRAVLPFMKKQSHGKIISLSGGGATKPTPNMSAYAASKAAIVRFSETVSEEVKKYAIDMNTVAPGALNTRLLDELLQAGPTILGEKRYQEAVLQQQSGGSNPADAAQLCVFLASNESDGITGKLISAVWDPWQNLSHYKEHLKNSDIYTLRRIVPSDRGDAWE